MQLLAFCIFDQKVKQKFEQEIKKEIEQNIKQKIKQIFPRRNKCGTALENYYSEMVKRLLENGANSNDLFYEVIDKIASGYGPKGYDFKPKWREYKNKKARYYSSTDLLHILDYLLKNNLVDPYRHDKNGALPLAKLMFSGYLYTLLDVYNTNKCYVNGIDCCLDAVFLLLDYGANYEFKSGEIRKLLLNTVK
ncbi:hypothetical protein [Cardinium endosymbiont of Sogatella furcifera]|uniref:hypothetical protein n=1 Tax=Cardinium endosymbiont of Sogatella furcifera TaxID=650378 RepID=UPI0013B46927|nr:hypothetical protein [Cardinium endosymbiont of Sogatella furcifera]